MCGGKYKYDRIGEQFSLDNSEREDEQNAFVENVYGGITSKPCQPFWYATEISPEKTEDIHRNGNNDYGIFWVILWKY